MAGSAHTDISDDAITSPSRPSLPHDEDMVTLAIPRAALAVVAARSDIVARRGSEQADVHGDVEPRAGHRDKPRRGDRRRERIMAALATLVDALLDPPDSAKSDVPEYYSADRLPPGEKSWRAVLERGRRGAYELVHVGRHVVVPAASYAAWIASSSTPSVTPRTTRLPPSKLDRLARMGVAVQTARRDRR